VFIKLKYNKIISLFSQPQKYIISLYLDDDMLRSIDLHQATFTKLRIRYMQSKYHSCDMGSHKTYKCIKVY
jgi:hypothetical protein